MHNLNDLSRVEAENIMLAQLKYLRPNKHPKVWFHIKELKTIHRTMFGNVWEWAGEYRKAKNSIGVNPAFIPSQLADLCFDVMAWIENSCSLTFIEMAARIHHRLVFIHPFENGNGRFSRLIADRFLISLNCTYPEWPVSLNREGMKRSAYISALKAADRGDYSILKDLMLKLGAQERSSAPISS